MLDRKKRWSIPLILAACLLAPLAQARPGPDSNYNISASGGGATYTGPGDINGAAYAFWSTRCGANSYTGNVVDIWDAATGSTTETLITCSPGGVLNQTINSLATTCASGCRAKTIYDQSGGNNCGGAACNVTQATNANRPSVTTSCLNGKICLVFNGSSSCLANSTSVATQAQPYTISTTHNTTTSGGLTALFAATNGLVVGSGGANTWSLYAGGAQPTVTANDSTTHAIQTLFNTTASSAYVDGSANAGLSPGSDTLTTDLDIGGGANCAAFFWTGNWFETGIWAADKTANNSAMNSNQHTFWNF